MFFIIAGIQPKIVKLDDQPRMCPSCGLNQARLKRVDHYFSVFFIPIFRVKKGLPFLECQRCGSPAREIVGGRSESRQGPGHICTYCGKPIDSAYRFCPFCGKAQ